jgi:uncharacterized SAM-dependent methyltransferase
VSPPTVSNFSSRKTVARKPAPLGDAEARQLQKDAIALFKGSQTAHMGRWCYGSAPYGYRPSGTNLWRQIVDKKGGMSVLSEEEQLILRFSLTVEGRALLRPLRSACELGTGSASATERKILPLLGLSDRLRSYTAIDFCEEFGAGARELIAKKLGVDTSWIRAHVFEADWPALKPPSDLILAFDMITNMIAPQGASPEESLTAFFRKVLDGLGDGGVFIASFCSDMSGDNVIRYYMDETNHQFRLGTIRRIGGILPIEGEFDPSVWRYEPRWYDDAGQCAHTAYPTVAQSFSIGRKTFHIPAGKRHHLSNSYRYTKSQICRYAAEAGFSHLHVFHHGSAGLLVAQKGWGQACKFYTESAK